VEQLNSLTNSLPRSFNFKDFVSNLTLDSVTSQQFTAQGTQYAEWRNGAQTRQTAFTILCHYKPVFVLSSG